MTKHNSKNKGSLLLSLLSTVMCFAMLVATTYAWFTDTATSGINKIVAGNLDVELQDADGETLAADASLFKKDFKWEPGALLIGDEFQVANVGNLALTYVLSLKAVEEVKTPDGHSLSEVIKVAEVNDTYTDRQSMIDGCTWTNIGSYSKNVITMTPGAKDKYQLALYWEPNSNAIDNQYNMNNGNQGKTLSITFGVNVFATQTAYENDSFGNTYDQAKQQSGASLSKSKAAYTLKGAFARLSGDVNNEEYCKLKGVGTFSLNGYNVVCGATNGLIVEGDITLVGPGTISNSGNGYGLTVQGVLDTKKANVTIDAGVEVTNLYLIDGATVTIKSGAVVKGFINVGNPETLGYAESKLIIEDAEAVKDAIFQVIDEKYIEIPAGYTWDKSYSWSTGGAGTDAMKLVKA